MPMKSKPPKSPLDKVLGRIDDLDEVNLGILVQRLARERKLLRRYSTSFAMGFWFWMRMAC